MGDKAFNIEGVIDPLALSRMR